jgi:hypothetical protein
MGGSVRGRSGCGSHVGMDQRKTEVEGEEMKMWDCCYCGYSERLEIH